MSGERADWIGAHRDRDDLSDRADLVESAPPVSPARRRMVVLLVVIVAIVGCTAWYVDNRRRAHEYTALLQCMATAESAWSDANARVVAMASYVRPGVFSGPPARLQLSLYNLVAGQAASGEPPVRRALRRCQDVPVLAFHPTLRTARTAYLESLQAEVDLLVATANDGSRAFASSEAITRLRGRAVTALSAAAPDDRSRRTAQRLMGPR